MTKCLEIRFPIKCWGRDSKGEHTLEKAVKVEVQVYQIPNTNMISSSVSCKYNVGGHGQRCKASHPKVNKVGKGIICPYSFDIPYALEIKNRS